MRRQVENLRIENNLKFARILSGLKSPQLRRMRRLGALQPPHERPRRIRRSGAKSLRAPLGFGCASVCFLKGGGGEEGTSAQGGSL